MYRETISLSCSVANPDFAADLEFVAHRLTEGVRLFKVKTGFSTHKNDLARLERLKSIMPPDAELRVDYHQGMQPWDAIRQLRDIEVKPGFIEQPVPRNQRAALGEITRALDTPILADESVFTPADAIGLVRDRFADCVSIKLMKCGGMLPAKDIAAIAQAAGMPCYGGTMFEGGVALAAGIHFAAPFDIWDDHKVLLIQLGAASVPATAGARVYDRQTPGLRALGADGVVAEVSAHPDDATLVGLKNLSQLTWAVTTDRGERRDVAPGRTIRIARGTRLQLGDIEATVR